MLVSHLSVIHCFSVSGIDSDYHILLSLVSCSFPQTITPTLCFQHEFNNLININWININVPVDSDDTSLYTVTVWLCESHRPSLEITVRKECNRPISESNDVSHGHHMKQDHSPNVRWSMSVVQCVLWCRVIAGLLLILFARSKFQLFSFCL